ncbi:MAG TPA: ABC transporter ATP-binding protein [Chthoniobacteraceae bacterium]|jgi:ABC-type lipoprotein export system ATPase subunit|nr:ABC transporter ATP-binding protein [Chthoniobacteraceae bacterium]
MTDTPILRAGSLAKSYDGTPILRGISLTLERGERVALTGPSGSGKTTLLNCLSGVDRADTGEVWWGGQAVHALDRRALALLQRRHCGNIFQFFHLLPTLTAAENIELPLQLLGEPAEARRARVGELLSRVGLAHRAEAFPSQLSGGEMQRVAIARALSHRPPMLVADEPTGNLDSANSERVLELTRELCEEHGTALLLVTHSEEAARICHRTLHILDGAILPS